MLVLHRLRIVGVLAMLLRRQLGRVHKPQALHLQPGRKVQATAEQLHSAYVAHQCRPGLLLLVSLMRFG